MTTPNPCGRGSTQFFCRSSQKCIDGTLVCNFHNDCPNGEDETNCGNCDFERTDRPMCGWTNIGVGKEQWSVMSASVSANQYANQLPSKDGNGNYTGHYLVIDTTKGLTKV